MMTGQAWNDGAVLYAARYRSRCPGCRVLLLEGMPIFKLAGGWGCYRCDMAAEQVVEAERRRRRADEMVRVLLDDIELVAREPDRCDSPARKLSPVGRTAHQGGADRSALTQAINARRLS